MHYNMLLQQVLCKLENIYQDDTVEKMGFELPFIVKLSHNLILYDLLDKVYLTDKGVLDKLWP